MAPRTSRWVPQSKAPLAIAAHQAWSRRANWSYCTVLASHTSHCPLSEFCTKRGDCNFCGRFWHNHVTWSRGGHPPHHGQVLGYGVGCMWCSRSKCGDVRVWSLHQFCIWVVSKDGSGKRHRCLPRLCASKISFGVVGGSTRVRSVARVL